MCIVYEYLKTESEGAFTSHCDRRRKKGTTAIIPSVENHRECPDMPPCRRTDRIFTVLRLCPAFSRTSSVWCIMSCWNRVKPSQGICIVRNWCVWAEHWRKNGHSAKRDTTKLSSSITMLDHMSEDLEGLDIRSEQKVYLRVLPTLPIPKRPELNGDRQFGWKWVLWRNRRHTVWCRHRWLSAGKTFRIQK